MARAGEDGYDAAGAARDEAQARLARETAFNPKADQAGAGNLPHATADHDGAESTSADAIDPDDPQKVEKLSKLGNSDDAAAEGTE